MTPNACFRVAAAEVATDFHKYLELARTRSFEIWHDGKVEVMLVPIAAVREWHDTLRVSSPVMLSTDKEKEAISASQMEHGDDDECSADETGVLPENGGDECQRVSASVAEPSLSAAEILTSADAISRDLASPIPDHGTLLYDEHGLLR